MAWCLGFIAADGCILLGPRNGGTLSITVSQKDKEILKKINHNMKSNYPIRNIKTNLGTSACRLDITVREIVDDLIKIGITPKKSKTLKWPQSIPSELSWHFIRGYYDGDGSIMFGKGYVNKKGFSNLQLRTSVLGTKDVLSNIKKYFTNLYPEYNPKIQDQSKNGFYRLEISGTKSAVALCELLYKDSSESTRLSRKYLKYKHYIS
jgi:intein/homing endonuclease